MPITKPPQPSAQDSGGEAYREYYEAHRALIAAERDAKEKSSAFVRGFHVRMPEANERLRVPRDEAYAALNIANARFQSAKTAAAEQPAKGEYNCPGNGKPDPMLHAPNCPARLALQPVAWMRDCGLPIDEEACAITDRIKRLWQRSNPQRVERYTIPLYATPQPSDPADAFSNAVADFEQTQLEATPPTAQRHDAASAKAAYALYERFCEIMARYRYTEECDEKMRTAFAAAIPATHGAGAAVEAEIAGWQYVYPDGGLGLIVKDNATPADWKTDGEHRPVYAAPLQQRSEQGGVSQELQALLDTARATGYMAYTSVGFDTLERAIAALSTQPLLSGKGIPLLTKQD